MNDKPQRYNYLPLAPGSKPQPKQQRSKFAVQCWHVWIFLKLIGRIDPWDRRGLMGPGFAWKLAGILAGKH